MNSKREGNFGKGMATRRGRLNWCFNGHYYVNAERENRNRIEIVQRGLKEANEGDYTWKEEIQSCKRF